MGNSDAVLNQTTQAVEETVKTREGKLRVGIIGTGWIAEAHAESLKKMDDVEIVAMADLIPGKAEAFAARFGIENVNFYPDHAAMLANEKLFMPNPSNPLYLRLEKLFDLHELPLPPRNVYSLMIRLKMVSENQGITFITNSATQAIPLPNIRFIPLATPFEPWNAKLYWRKNQPLNQYETTVKDFFQHFSESLH